MIDTHCHLTFDVFAGRVDEVVSDAKDAGVTGMITVATSTQAIEANCMVAEQFEHVWFSAGVHPLHVDDEPHEWRLLRTAAEHPKCVAWGELGLDNHYEKPPHDLQVKTLERQLAELESLLDEPSGCKPVILHCRDAFDDLIPILKSTRLPAERFVFHCFTGTPVDARHVLDFGAWISFTGVVTFANAKEVAESAKAAPRDRIMVETDAPFLTPAPMRKAWPNEPKYVVHTARFIAELRGETFDGFASQLDDNASRFFGIEIP